MDGKGGVYKYRLIVAAKSAPPPPALPEKFRIFTEMGHAAVPVWRRYDVAALPADAHVVMVESLANAMYEPMGLVCRLHGLRMCDKEWLSKMKSGNVVCFASALQMHLYWYLTEDFCIQHAKHAEILLGCAEAAEQGMKLKVAKGPLPAKPKHPRLSFQVCYKPRAEEVTEIDLQAMVEKLTCLRQERAAT